MRYGHAVKLMKEIWDSRNTGNLKFSVTKPTAIKPGYIMIWNKQTTIRRVYSDGFSRQEVLDMLTDIKRLENNA